jgi:hypothetical protein
MLIALNILLSLLNLGLALLNKKGVVRGFNFWVSGFCAAVALAIGILGK